MHWKSTYIISSAIFQIAMVIIAIVTPVWVTPGWYVWTAICLLFAGVNSLNLKEHFDEWHTPDEEDVNS